MKLFLYWSGIIVSVAIGIYLEGGHINSFLQSTAAIIVFGPVVSYVLFSLGLVSFWDLIMRLNSGKCSDQDRVSVEKMTTIGFSFGTLSVIIGLIHLMENLAEPSKLGAGMAEIIVSSIYGFIPCVLFYPLVTGNLGDGTMKKSLAYSVAVVGVLFFAMQTGLHAPRI